MHVPSTAAAATASRPTITATSVQAFIATHAHSQQAFCTTKPAVIQTHASTIHTHTSFHMALVTILFADPQRQLPHENKSKLLQLGSPLYDFILASREKLVRAGATIDVRQPHIELIGGKETQRGTVLSARASHLHNVAVPLTIKKMGKALVVPTPAVEGYGETHATIAYFSNGLSQADANEYIRLLLC